MEKNAISYFKNEVAQTNQFHLNNHISLATSIVVQKLICHNINQPVLSKLHLQVLAGD